MVFPVVGGDGKPTGYEIDNSLRFNDDDAPRLTKTFSSSGNRRTVTFSAWFKLSTLGTLRYIFANNGADSIHFDTNDFLNIELAGAAEGYLFTNKKFRDVSAWYHIVVAVDTTQGTASNRLKLYINGSQETSFSDSTNPDQNLQTGFAENVQHAIGMRSANVDRHFDGYLAEVNFVDGSALDSTYFGETNDNGVWIPKEPDVSSYGTNGFFQQYKQSGTGTDSSGMGADTSGQDNHFAVTNLAAIDVTTDTPTNNFNTLNPLVPHHSIFNDTTEGNTGLSSSGVELRGGHFGTTIMPSNGKWYFEVKILTTGSSDRTGLSIANFESVVGDDHIEGGDFKGFTISTGTTGRVAVTNGSSTAETDISGYQFSDDDIAIFAVDMDASTPRVYVGKNGTWFTTSAASGGNPATNTGYFEVVLGNGFSVGARHSAGSSTSQSYLYNFGQPAFSISSGNADANGYGNFEYSVPSGYYSINTKNLAEFG